MTDDARVTLAGPVRRGADPRGGLHDAVGDDRRAGVRDRGLASGRASSRSPAGSTRRGTAGGPGRSASSPGFGNAEQTNERYRMILNRGGGGLSVAFDMPTLMGRDSDDRKSLGEVGHCGVAIDSAADMDRLFDDDPARGRHHVDDDQRPGRPGLLHDARRGRAPGRRHRQAQRHPADRHLQGVHRPEGVAVRPRAAPAADRRPDGVLRGEDPGVQAALGLRLPHP